MVVVATMSGLITFGALSTVPALDWLRPVLITTDWSAVLDVLRDPISGNGMLTGLLRAGCHLVIGVSATVARVVTEDA